MTVECLNRIQAIADNELTKLVTHMENSEPDRRDICVAKDLLKIHKLVMELSTMLK